MGAPSEPEATTFAASRAPQVFSFGSTQRVMLVAFLGLAVLEGICLELLIPNTIVKFVGVLAHVVVLVGAIRLIRRTSSDFGHRVDAEGISIFGLAHGHASFAFGNIQAARREVDYTVKRPRIMAGVLHVPIAGASNVVLTLRTPVNYRFSSRADGEVSTVRVWADEPDGFVQCIEAHLTNPG